MPQKAESYEGTKARDLANKEGWFTPNLNLESESLEKVERLELWESLFHDPGQDWSEWRAYDSEGNLLGRRRMKGY